MGHIIMVCVTSNTENELDEKKNKNYYNAYKSKEIKREARNQMASRMEKRTKIRK